MGLGEVGRPLEPELVLDPDVGVRVGFGATPEAPVGVEVPDGVPADIGVFVDAGVAVSAATQLAAGGVDVSAGACERLSAGVGVDVWVGVGVGVGVGVKLS